MKGRAYKALVPAHQRFLDLYVQGMTGTAAMRLVDPTLKRPEVRASKILAREDVRAALAELNEDIAARAGIEAAQVLREIAHVAFADIRELYDDGGELRPIHELTREQAAQIAGVEVEETAVDGAPVGRLLKIKRESKLRALELLANHPAIFPDATQQPGGNVFNIQINIGAAR
jgi:phage terminase small subunit